MSKNTRWALAIVVAAILMVAVLIIATGHEDTKATPESGGKTNTAPTHTTGPTQGGGSTGTTGGGSGSGTNSGGATPGSGSGGSDDNGSGGASPGGASDNGSGGAQAQTSTSPVLQAGSTKTIVVNKGDTVTIRARSNSDDELHIHGYDKEVPLTPGKTGSVTFKANIDGLFSIELHPSETQVGTLRVNP